MIKKRQNNKNEEKENGVFNNKISNEWRNDLKKLQNANIKRTSF